MLPMTPSYWAREIDAAIAFRRKHTNRIKEIVKRGIGTWFREEMEGSPLQVENDIHAYKAFMLPELAFSAPAGRVTAKRPSLYEDVGDAIGYALQEWSRESEFEDERELVINDCLDAFGIMQVGVEPMEPGGGTGEGPLKVYANRVPQDRFLIDPQCEAGRHAMWWGHSYFRMASSLANSTRFDPEAVKQFSSSSGRDNSERAMAQPNEPLRQLVELIDIYIPGENLILTLAGLEGGRARAVFVRPPEKYWGPDSGPYQFYGLYDVPGDPFPMSNIQAWMSQSEEKNAHLKQAADEAATAKSIWLVDSGADDVKNAIVDGVNGGVYSVRDLQNKAQKVETGTMSNQRLDYIETCRVRMDRVAGLTDAQRGRASQATATESQIVQSSADVRVRWDKRRILRADQSVLRKVGWYLFYDSNIVMPISATDPLSGETIEGTYLGGPQAGQENLDWTDFNLEIDPQSIEIGDDQVIQQRWLQIIALAPQIYQMATMYPGINVRWLADQLGQSMNIPRFSEKLFGGMLGQLPGMMAAAQSGMVLPQQPGQPVQPGRPQPMGGMGGGPGAAMTRGAVPPVSANLGGQRPMPGMGQMLAMGGR